VSPTCDIPINKACFVLGTEKTVAASTLQFIEYGRTKENKEKVKFSLNARKNIIIE
jgi:hypothetical protein